MFKEQHMYIWLKKGTYDEALLKKQGIDVSMEKGEPVVRVYCESCLDPTLRLPAVPVEIVDHVTVQETIATGFVRDGIYRSDSTELMAKTDVSISFSMDEPDRVFQRLHGRADSVASIVDLMKRVRSHALRPLPEDDWMGPYQDLDDNSSPSQPQEPKP